MAGHPLALRLAHPPLSGPHHLLSRKAFGGLSRCAGNLFPEEFLQFFASQSHTLSPRREDTCAHHSIRDRSGCAPLVRSIPSGWRSPGSSSLPDAGRRRTGDCQTAAPAPLSLCPLIVDVGPGVLANP